MSCTQILLPLYDNHGQPVPRDLFGAVATELTERFGGATAYTRAPAQGLWKEGGAPINRDDIVVYEALAEQLDRAWWNNYRRSLGSRFRQEKIVVRAQEAELL